MLSIEIMESCDHICASLLYNLFTIYNFSMTWQSRLDYFRLFYIHSFISWGQKGMNEIVFPSVYYIEYYNKCM